eukprot:442384-Pleurochrysis_carterae.AAC.1
MYKINERHAQNKKEEIQAEKAMQAIQQARGHKDRKDREEEELALKQMISGIIPEWQHVDDNKKKGAIVMMRSWTGELMNHARIHMKVWIEKKNEHKAMVQRRWDNRGKTLQIFMRWRRKVGYRQAEQESPDGEKGEKVEKVERGGKEKTYGIQYWGR